MSASMSANGMPAVPKPPIITVEPSFTSARASAAEALILSIMPSPLHLHRVASVDGYRRAGDEVGGRRGEEHGDTRKVVGHAPALGRRAHEYEAVEPRYLLARPFRQLGVNPARQHGIDLDIVLGPGGGQRFRQLHHPTLGGPVRGREGGT